VLDTSTKGLAVVGMSANCRIVKQTFAGGSVRRAIYEMGSSQGCLGRDGLSHCGAAGLHGVDPYTYLVDVLQRVAEHPASRVAELTPRLWKE
jgi:hypothetical protein